MSKKHPDDFSKIAFQFVKGFRLRVSARPTGDIGHVQGGLGASLNNGSIAFHATPRLVSSGEHTLQPFVRPFGSVRPYPVIGPLGSVELLSPNNQSVGDTRPVVKRDAFVQSIE